MGTMTHAQVNALGDEYERRVPVRARELMDAGAPLNPNRISGFGAPFADYLDEAARQIVGGRFEWSIQEQIQGDAMFFITKYMGEATDG